MLQPITLNIEKQLLEKAKKQAIAENKNLNEIFVEWLKRYTSEDTTTHYNMLMEKLSYVSPGKLFSRHKLNKR